MKNLMASKLFWLFLILIFAGSFGFYRYSTRETTTYRKFKVERSDLSISILATGTVQPENRLEIKAPIAGRIDQVLIEEGAKIKKGQILAWMSSTERAALIDAARARGPEEVKKWEEIYRPTPILAPLPGTLILRNIEPGQTITATDAILAMSDRLTVKAQVDETDIARIQLKQSARIVLDAYPDVSIEARVDQIAFEAKTVNNVTTYLVDVLPLKTPDIMRSGMTANVTFDVEDKKAILSIPSEAVQVIDGKTQVLVQKDKSEKPENRVVTLGSTDGKKTEVLEGLEENETIVRADQSKTEKTKASNPFSPFGGKRPPGSGRSR